MKAIRFDAYGAADVLVVRQVLMPEIGGHDVLVRVRAASVNQADAHLMRGSPFPVRVWTGLRRPRAGRLGADMAGEVADVGESVTAFKPGDAVFGGLSGFGTLAEYVAVRDDAVLLTGPAGLTTEQAAAVPLAGFTALQAVRDKARVRTGQRVLVNGASGGVGTFAVQIAKALGAEVTGVCGPRNLDLVASIGADHVLDYTREDFTATGQRYDAVIDIAGSHSVTSTRRALTSRGVLVGVGGPDRQWLSRPATMAVLSLTGRQRMASFVTRQRRADLAALREFLDAGTITPVIDRTYPLSEVPDAIRYLETRHARGKVVITI